MKFVQKIIEANIKSIEILNMKENRGHTRCIASGLKYIFEKIGINADLSKFVVDIPNLSDYKDKVIVVVNVASRCGYTPQYEDLQFLWSLKLLHCSQAPSYKI